MNSDWKLGIDFGTTNTRIALRSQGIPTSLQIGESNNFMPSVVSYRKNSAGKAEVEAIGESALSIPENREIVPIREIKRSLLSTEPGDQKFMLTPDSWSIENHDVRLWDSILQYEDVIYEILNEALERAVKYARDIGLNEDLSRANITALSTRIGVPVVAGPQTRDRISKVMKRLGFFEFKVAQIVEEPSLAIEAYSNLGKLQDTERVMIYDLGGGTFDVAIMEIAEGNEVTVLAVDGEPIGGFDIDTMFRDYLIKRIGKEVFDLGHSDFKGLLEGAPLENHVLWERCKNLKELLSTEEEADLVLQNFMGDPVVSIKVSRKQLETVVNEPKINGASIFQNTSECCLRAFKRSLATLGGSHAETGAAVDAVMSLTHKNLSEFVDRILVVGGSTKMPLIRAQIAETWGPQLLVNEGDLNPIEAVAVGGAWQNCDVSKILTRLPFSIYLNFGEGVRKELYSAFTSTSNHKTLTANPRIEPYVRSFNLNSTNVSQAFFSLIDLEGNPIGRCDLGQSQGGAFKLEIDAFSRILIKRPHNNLILEIPNPNQHERQKVAALEQDAAEKQREDERKARGAANFRRSPFLDN